MPFQQHSFRMTMLRVYDCSERSGNVVIAQNPHPHKYVNEQDRQTFKLSKFAWRIFQAVWYTNTVQVSVKERKHVLLGISMSHNYKSQMAERLGNWASNQKVAGSIPGRDKGCCDLGQGTSCYLPRRECPCTYCKSLWIRASAKWLNVQRITHLSANSQMNKVCRLPLLNSHYKATITSTKAISFDTTGWI